MQHRIHLQHLPQVRPLKQDEVESALAWLASPTLSPPPSKLEMLSQLEWFLLQQFLQSLLQERDNNPLQ